MRAHAHVRAASYKCGTCLTGKAVGVAVSAHAAAHAARWATQGNIHLLWDHVTGRSGLVSLLCTPLIVLPARWAKSNL